MNRSDLDELLVEALCQYGILGNKKAIATIMKKLPTIAVYHSIDWIDENSFNVCVSALSSQGSIIDSNGTAQTIVGIVGSGLANMNPAIVIIKIDGNTIHIASAAKEGLIKQHTAEKAVQTFFTILQHDNGKLKLN